MVASGNDRLRLQVKHTWILAAGALIGFALPSGAIGAEASRLLTTFMGFFTAGVLPTISILIGTVTSSGRSVKALNDVHGEIRTAIEALISLLKLAGTTVAMMFLLSIVHGPYPVLVAAESIAAWLSYIPTAVVSAQGTTIDLAGLVLRVGQGVVVCLALAFTLKATTLPKALYAALQSKHQLAIEEARRSLDEKAPKAPEIKRAFAGGVEFGTVVRMDEKG